MGLARDGRSVRVRYRSGAGAVVETTLDRVDVGEVVAGQPVREFRWVKGQRHYSGWYWSATTGGLVVYESLLELDRIMLADFADDVVGIAAQPFQLIGADGEQRRRHVPDVLLAHAHGGVTVVDVKPAHRVDDPKVRAVFEWTDRVVAARGWSFEVWSGAAADLLANVRFLAGYRRASVVDHSLVAPVLEGAAGGSTITGLERVVTARAGLVRPVVLHLLWHGRLTADLSTPLDGGTVVTTSGPEL